MDQSTTVDSITDQGSTETHELDQTFAQIRPRLLAFTRMHVNTDADAEDVVQDTILSAWKNRGRFRGESRFETWVFGILRYKLLDLYKTRSRIKNFEFNDKDLADINDQFDGVEHWAEGYKPKSWKSPSHHFESDDFWRVFDICVDHLPDKTARVYTLRELLGIHTDEICDVLQISEANCWTILHRARLKLRSCLESSWFEKGETL